MTSSTNFEAERAAKKSCRVSIHPTVLLQNDSSSSCNDEGTVPVPFAHTSGELLRPNDGARSYRCIS